MRIFSRTKRTQILSPNSSLTKKSSRYLSILWATLILIGAVIPTIPLENRYYPMYPHADKVVHFLLYTIFGLLAYYGYSQNNRTNLKTGTLIVLYAMIVEFLHLFIPYRAFEWQDILANILGTGAGILFCIIIPLDRIIR